MKSSNQYRRYLVELEARRAVEMKVKMRKVTTCHTSLSLMSLCRDDIHISYEHRTVHRKLAGIINNWSQPKDTITLIFENKFKDFSKSQWFFKNSRIFQKFKDFSKSQWFFKNSRIFKNSMIFQKLNEFSKIQWVFKNSEIKRIPFGKLSILLCRAYFSTTLI